MKAVQTKKCKDGDVIIIRHEGPRGGPGMPENVIYHWKQFTVKAKEKK